MPSETTRGMDWLLGCALGALALSCGGGPRDGEPSRSVVLVTCDTLRRDALEPYGAPAGCSPSLARLAEEALVFEDAWSGASSTLPALSSLFTRRTPDELGVTAGNRLLLGPEVVTLTERLSEAGIETAAFVSNAVLRRFPTPIGEVALAQGFEHYDDRMVAKERNRRLLERSAPDTVRAALDWLDAREDPLRPSFLWLHFIEPHGPYTSGEPLALEGEEPTAELPLGTTDRGLGEIPRYQDLGGERDPAAYRAAYRGEVRYLDAAIGDLLDGLRTRGHLDRSTFVLSADHGESLGERDWWFTHGQSLAPELVRVPLIVRVPGATIRGRRAGLVGPFALHDTLLSSAGVLPPERSVTTPGAEHWDPLVVQQRGRPGTATHETAVTDGRFRLTWDGAGGERLTDLWSDPAEERDLRSQRPGVADRLRERFRSFGEQRRALPEVRALHVNDVFDLRAAAQHGRELEALGYGGD